MELYQIRYFLALCDTLNFARAAERCGVCQPSLSRAVQKLEAELGGLLVRRERRLTHLTDLGRAVRPMLEAILAQAEAAKQEARRFLSAQNRPMRLGIIPSIGPRRLAPFLARFSAENLDAELTLVEANGAAMQEMLLSGALEVALATREAMANERLRRHPLYCERFVVVFAPGHRFKRLNGVRLVDLRGEHFLLRTHCELRETLLEACRKRGFALDIVHRSERDDWVQQMVAAGRGVAVLPEYAPLGEATLARPLIDPVLAREAALVTVAGRPHAPWVHLLMRAARAYKWDKGEAAVIESQPAPPPLVTRSPGILAGVSR
jgi:LysR family transcriptional regulator, hydrogen peroxide-inducible genes activator